MEILLILSLINALFALVSIVIGIFVLFRVAGKFFYTSLFIILSVGIIFIRDIFFFFGVNAPVVTSLMRGASILLSLLAILFIQRIVKIIDGHWDNHKSKKRK